MNYIVDEEFGRVYVTIRRGMKNITMRWKGNELYMNAPQGVTLSDLQDTLNSFRERLRETRPGDKGIKYRMGMTIECYGFTIEIAEQRRDSNHAYFHFDESRNVQQVLVWHEFDFDEPSNVRFISKCVATAAHNNGYRILMPLASRVAQQVGVAPKQFIVGSGLRKLGHCTRDGVIQLSSNLLFLPENLIVYIICHELAHLTHHDHSPQFHELVNTYVGGREKELDAQVKHFPWPIFK